MRRMTAIAGAAIFGAALLVSPAQAAAPAWRNVKSGALSYKGTLDRIDVVDKKTAWAIGGGGSLFSPSAYLLRWNGTSWTRQNSPVGFVPTGVAAASAKRAWGVGFNLSGPAAVYWNGKKWSKVAYPMVGIPAAVSAAKDGTAWSLAGVDTSGGGLSAVLRWTGTKWATVKVPAPAGAGITAVHARGKNDVWLAGSYSPAGLSVVAFTLHWNGKSWKRLTVPGTMGTPSQQGLIQRVVAVSSTNVWVLRTQRYNAVLHWNGKSWKQISMLPAGVSMTDDGKSGVWITQATNLGSRPTYLHWTGTAWKTVYGASRTGTVTSPDLDRIPGTTSILSVGSSGPQDKRAPYLEQYK